MLCLSLNRRPSTDGNSSSFKPAVLSPSTNGKSIIYLLISDRFPSQGPCETFYQLNVLVWTSMGRIFASVL